MSVNSEAPNDPDEVNQMTNFKPRQSPGIVTTIIENETIVYVPTVAKAILLPKEAAAVFHACDGSRELKNLVACLPTKHSTEYVQDIVAALMEAGLVQEHLDLKLKSKSNLLSRRSIIKAAIPAMMVLTLPLPSAASSGLTLSFSTAGTRMVAVPAGCTLVNITTVGGDGRRGGDAEGGLGNATGGLGARGQTVVTNNVSVVGGETLTVVVGERGEDGQSVDGPVAGVGGAPGQGSPTGASGMTGQDGTSDGGGGGGSGVAGVIGPGDPGDIGGTGAPGNLPQDGAGGDGGSAALGTGDADPSGDGSVVLVFF